MDEWMLNDLLECSVCLERLDTSSKVLPCQHTFCKKCLEDILTTNKELRCPECRVLVDVKIDELPPNVLLMRILEGMRNAAPKKRNSTGGSVRLGAPASSGIAQSVQPSSLPPMLAINHNVAEHNATRVLAQPAATVKVNCKFHLYSKVIQILSVILGSSDILRPVRIVLFQTCLSYDLHKIGLLAITLHVKHNRFFKLK